MISQFRGDSRTITLETIGYIDGLNNFTFEYKNNENDETVFPGKHIRTLSLICIAFYKYVLFFLFLLHTLYNADGVPSDGTLIEVISSYHLALVITYDILAFLGLIYTTVCLVFNFVFRKRK